MQAEICPQETAAVRAQRSGQWEPALTAHVDGCPGCREAVRISGWMQNLAAGASQRRALPDPELLWIKSQLFGRQAQADRAYQPLWIGETLARAVVGAFAAAWLALSWPTIQAFVIGALTQSGGTENLLRPAGSPWPITLASLAVALALVGAVRYVHPRLTRD
jgi:hypothetical protein